MAIATNTFTTYDAIGQREDLSDIITNIAPVECPFQSNAEKGTASAKLHEWQTDTLAAALSTNAAIEGDDAVAAGVSLPTVRVANYLQILTKIVQVTDTEDTAVVKAGRASEMSYQMAKKSKELKRDLEKNLLENIAGAAGSISVARKMATMGAWLKTNINKDAAGTTPTYASGVPGFARTDGTQRTFTETILKDVMVQCYNSGAETSTLMVGPVNKQRVSGFAGIAVNRFNVKGATSGTIIGAADIYVSDFGNLSIVPNRFQRERDAWFLNFEYLGIDFLRPFQAFMLAKTGDNTKKEMLVECTLRVANEASQGLAADLTTV